MMQPIQEIAPSTLPAWPWTIAVGVGLDALTAPSMRLSHPPVLPPQEQLTRFIDALFEPDDLVEIRVIAASRRGSSESSPLIGRQWIAARQLSNHFDRLRSHNESGGHVFFGVNPRARTAGTKNAVTLCRSVWLDFDRVSHDEAAARWSAVLPEPTIVVRSGSGIHAYWLLDSPQSVSTASSRQRFEQIVKGLSLALDADATHDVTRLLRLPGFANPKTEVPLPCELLVCEPNRRFPMERFERQAVFSESRPPVVPPVVGNMDRRTRQRIQGLVRHLDEDVADRSRRDFAVVCGLLRLGLGSEQIRPLVAGRSKFARDDAYFETTIHNALRRLGMSGDYRPDGPSGPLGSTSQTKF